MFPPWKKNPKKFNSTERSAGILENGYKALALHLLTVGSMCVLHSLRQ